MSHKTAILNLSAISHQMQHQNCSCNSWSKIFNDSITHLSRPEPTSGDVVTCFLASSSRSRTQPFLLGYNTSSFCSTCHTSHDVVHNC